MARKILGTGLDLSSQKIINLADGTNPSDAVTKAQLDAIARGLDWKNSVRVATTANITLSAAQTIDGISVVAGDRVLVKDQSSAVSDYRRNLCRSRRPCSREGPIFCGRKRYLCSGFGGVVQSHRL